MSIWWILISPLPLLKTFTLGTACELKVLNEKWLCERKKKKNCVAQQRECVIKKEGTYNVFCQTTTGKTNGFPFLDILGYLKNTHKNPKFGKVRQVPTREFLTKFPDWDLSHSSKFGISVGIL